MEKVGSDPQSRILSRLRNTAPEKSSLKSNGRNPGGEVLSRRERVLPTEETESVELQGCCCLW